MREANTIRYNYMLSAIWITCDVVHLMHFLNQMRARAYKWVVSG